MSEATRVHKNAYRNGNASSMLDYLEELILIQSGENGRLTIPETEQGYEDLAVTDMEVAQLTIPENGISATISIEADGSAAEKSRVVRFKENGSDPTASSGIALGENDLYEITGRWNLENFRVIGIEAGKSHVLRVQYYQSPNNT
ncbi:MAG TPA: hypothetical protein DCR04_09395 [Flavobacteriales bacterium]|jgi:hypothetical protein|nr:hypothetical protein [Flavobacteriales bacterium]